MNNPTWNPALYNQKHDFVYRYGEDLVAQLNPQTGERILDLGCGTGELTDQISQLGAEVVGIDSSSELIATAQLRFPHLTFRQQDATKLSDSEQYGAIFSNAVLHWIQNQDAATERMYRALKPSGRLVAELGGEGNVQQIRNALKKVLKRHGYTEQAYTMPWYFPSVGQHACLLERYGFQIQWMQHYARPTELSDAQNGIKDWLRMFAHQYLEGIAPDKQEAVLADVQEELRSVLYRNNRWYADYRRLRFIAIRPA